VRRSFCQSRPRSRLEAAISRQSGGKLAFVASIGIVARKSSDCRIRSAPQSCTLISREKDRPDV
jgi:hypothetical protein